jgi:hypothetical protein
VGIWREAEQAVTVSILGSYKSLSDGFGSDNVSFKTTSLELGWGDVAGIVLHDTKDVRYFFPKY